MNTPAASQLIDYVLNTSPNTLPMEFQNLQRIARQADFEQKKQHSEGERGVGFARQEFEHYQGMIDTLLAFISTNPTSASLSLKKMVRICMDAKAEYLNKVGTCIQQTGAGKPDAYFPLQNTSPDYFVVIAKQAMDQGCSEQLLVQIKILQHLQTFQGWIERHQSDLSSQSQQSSAAPSQTPQSSNESLSKS